jgi:hypothetical protein
VLMFLLSSCCSRVCSHLADSPPSRHGQSAWTRVRPVRRAFVVRSVETSVFSWEWFVDCLPVHRGPSERYELPVDRPRVGHEPSDFRGVHTGGFACFFGPSTPYPRNVCQAHASRQPGHHGSSAPCLADCLSPLLLELRFCVSFSSGLFLGLVGPL